MKIFQLIIRLEDKEENNTERTGGPQSARPSFRYQSLSRYSLLYSRTLRLGLKQTYLRKDCNKNCEKKNKQINKK